MFLFVGRTLGVRPACSARSRLLFPLHALNTGHNSRQVTHARPLKPRSSRLYMLDRRV